MKTFASILGLSLVTAVVAQEQCLSLVAKIPSCATTCIDSASGSAGCTDPKDLACLCKNTVAINTAALSCVLSSCGTETGLQVQSAAADVCKCVATAGPAAASSTSATSGTNQPASSAIISTTSPSISDGAVASTTGGATAASTTATQIVTSTSAAASGIYPAKQISDGQVQAGTAVTAVKPVSTQSPTVAPFQGAGAMVKVPMSGFMLALLPILAVPWML